MASTSLPPVAKADKALARQIVGFDESIENAEEFIGLMKTSAAKAPVQKEVAALRKRMKAALELAEKREMAKMVAELALAAKKAADMASDAMAKEIGDRYMAAWTKARGLLAQALVEVAEIEPLALRLPMQKEQADLRAQLDRIEKRPVKGLDSVVDVEDLLPKIEAFLKRMGSVGAAGQWMRSTYLPLFARVQAAIKRVPAERCRKSLLAELDFVEVDTNKALLKADTKAVQAGGVPTLQRIEKLVARIIAASPALDRELARLAKLVQGRADAAEATKRLKALVQAKAASWPDGASLDDIERSLGRFEADVAKLAAQLDKTPAAARA